MDSATAGAVRAALGRFLEAPSGGVCTFPEAQRLVELAGLEAHLMCGVAWSKHRAFLALSTTDERPRLIMRFDDDPGPDGSIGAVLSWRRQIDEDTWAYPIGLPCMTTQFFLRLASRSAWRDVRLSPSSLAVIFTHGWRDDLDPGKDFAEAMIDARELAQTIVQLVGIDPEAL